MIILAFETSCDDTSIALFKNTELLAMDTKSQIKVHNLTGGVVPEIAAREHANSIFEVLETVLSDTSYELNQIDHIAVTAKPGLMPSLLTWLTVARTLGFMYDIPVLEIDHIQAHIFANYLERQETEITYPLVCLTVSGWHNEIYYKQSMFQWEKIGATQDDAAGEAFDKVAKMMWLWYPWWPIISKLASEHTPSNKESLFPRVWLTKKENNFSFSWLKSAVKREVDKRWELTSDDKKEIAYEFQKAVIEVLSYKLIQAWNAYEVDTVMLAWGVWANNLLREEIQKQADKNNMKFMYPKKLGYCMDNAAMIGIMAYYQIKKQEW